MSIASYSSYACHAHQAVRQLCLVGRGIHCRCHTEARCVPRGVASFTSSSHLPPCNEPPFSRCCLCFSTTRNARVRRSYLSRSLRGRRYTRTPTRRTPSQWLLLTHTHSMPLLRISPGLANRLSAQSRNYFMYTPPPQLVANPADSGATAMAMSSVSSADMQASTAPPTPSFLSSAPPLPATDSMISGEVHEPHQQSQPQLQLQLQQQAQLQSHPHQPQAFLQPDHTSGKIGEPQTPMRQTLSNALWLERTVENTVRCRALIRICSRVTTLLTLARPAFAECQLATRTQALSGCARLLSRCFHSALHRTLQHCRF